MSFILAAASVTILEGMIGPYLGNEGAKIILGTIPRIEAEMLIRAPTAWPGPATRLLDLADRAKGTDRAWVYRNAARALLLAGGPWNFGKARTIER
jgi:hypothetical protein